MATSAFDLLTRQNAQARSTMPVGATPMYQTVHGPQTLAAMRSQLKNYGDWQTAPDALILRYYAQATGKPVTPATAAPPSATPAPTAAPAPTTAAPMVRKMSNPWQVNPAVWDSMGNMGQQLILGMAEQEGWDASDYERQINATRPIGQAARQTVTQYARPQRTYG